jgi:hypothetical protein
MNIMTSRTNLVSRSLPTICFAAIATLILVKAVIHIAARQPIEVLDLLIDLFLASGLFYMIAFTRSQLWMIRDDGRIVIIERDGILLYEGPLGDLRIIHEEAGIMSIRPMNGHTFLSPRRREFHPVLSRIADEPEGEQAAPRNR